MPRTLILSLDGEEFPVSMIKIDREKLYGSVEVEAFDEKGREASLRVLASDGKTLIDKGGTALATLDAKGNSIERNSLKPVDDAGDPLETVPSSFNAPNALKGSTADEYLETIVKSVYLLVPGEGADDIDGLKDAVSGSAIYRFPFSYRGGLEYDDAFIMGADGDAFMIVGRPAKFEFLSLKQAAVLDSEEEAEVSADDISFDLI